MFNRFQVCAAAFAVMTGGWCSVAGAQCTCGGGTGINVTITPSSAGTATCCVNSQTNHRDVIVVLNQQTGSTIEVLITASGTTQLGRVLVDNQDATGSEARLKIRGLQTGTLIGGVGYIGTTDDKDHRTVLVTELRVAGNVGYDRPDIYAIEADGISGADTSPSLMVEGSILGGIRSFGPGRPLGPLDVTGNLEGNILIAAGGSLLAVRAGGFIGPVAGNTPVAITVPGSVYHLKAASIKADVDTFISAEDGYGTIHRFETTDGAFTGSIHTQRLGPLATPQGVTAVTPEFRIVGDLAATLSIVRDVRAPFLVMGDFLAERDVGQEDPLANEITTGTGLFDTITPSTDEFRVEGDLGGSVSFGTPLTSGLQSINRNIVITGDLTGSLSTTGTDPATSGANANITVDGSVTGSITLKGSLNDSNTVKVGDNLAGTITLPANGLKGQVTINAANTGGTWTGTVNVGTIQLKSNNTASPDDSAPHYNRLPSELGGGSVGLAPFNMHINASYPEHRNSENVDQFGEDIFEADIATETDQVIVIPFYGPITRGSAYSTWRSGFEIQCRPLSAGDPCDWIVVSNGFDFHGPGDAGWTEPRVIRLSRENNIFPKPGIYRIVPKQNAVQCVGVAGPLAAEWPASCVGGTLPAEFGAYVFRIAPDCDGNTIDDQEQTPTPACFTDCHEADFNGSGSVSVQDIFDFLAAYFAGDPSANMNTNPAVTVQDLFDYLGFYFAC